MKGRGFLGMLGGAIGAAALPDKAYTRDEIRAMKTEVPIKNLAFTGVASTAAKVGWDDVEIVWHRLS